MPDDKATRLAQLRAQREAITAEILRLARELVADQAGLTGNERLTFIAQQSTVLSTKMEAQTAPAKTKGAKTSAAMTRSKAPLSLALMAAGKSIPEWVTPAREKQGLTVEAVRSWVKKPGHGGRPIPRAWADRIEAELGIPAIAASWPNGIRE